MAKMREMTLSFFRELFAGEEVPHYTDPKTGQQVVDMKKVCEKLGLDFDTEWGKILTDPILSRGLVVVKADHPPQH